MKRVACYVRVSTEEQKKHGISVENQIEELKNYCKEHKYQVAGIYNDAGISARKSYKKRPALLQLIEDCKKDKIDLIIFTKLDRWFRSVADYYDVQRILDEYKVPWACIWEDYETETSAGIFKVNIMLSVAQSEADRTSERINKTFEYKKAKGEVCSGSVGLGYKIEDKKWVKDKETEPIVNELFKSYLSNFSIRKTQDYLMELGHIIPIVSIQKITASPAYYGGLKYVTEPYITIEQHEQIMKAKKVRAKKKKLDYIFTGVGTCALCGARLQAHSSPSKLKSGELRHSITYYCGKNNKYHYLCEGVSINEKIIEKCLIDNLEKELDAHNSKLSEYMLEAGVDMSGKISNLKSRINRLKDLYELGDMELEEYKSKRDRLTEELYKLEEIPQKEVITLPENWRSVYNSLEPKLKNVFWLKTIDHFEVSERRANSIKIFF